jgi:hypothetical protein
VLKKNAKRNRYITVRGVQEPELFDNKKPQDHNRPVGVFEVLQALPQAHGT